jgi:putative hemolysin
MEIIVILILILLNGVFSMSEIALVSSRKFKLEMEAKKGNKNAQRALALANSPNTFLSTVQIGITLIGILTGIFSGKTLTTDLASFLARFEQLAPYADSMAVVIVVILITYLTIVLGELIPKRLGLSFPEKISSAVARPMTILSALTKPLIWILAQTNDFLLRLMGIKEKREGIVTEDEIKAIIAESTAGGEIQKIEQEIVKRVFALGDRRAGELRTYRTDLVWFDINATFEEVKKKVKEEPHSVYPVCDKNIDRLIGLVSLKQLFTKGIEEGTFDLKKLIQKPIFVPENMAAYRVLEHFKAHRQHCAIVVDEYGAIQGIITLDDVLDELIGDTLEEDSNDYQIIRRSENSWLVDGQFPYFELIEFLHIEEETEAEGFTTVGGLIIFLMKEIPKAGERTQWNGYELEVVDMDGQRIDKVMITKL